MSELRKYYVTYPSTEGPSTLEMDLEDDVELARLVPDILKLLQRTDGVAQPELFIMEDIDSTEQAPFTISFKPNPQKAASVVTGTEIRKALRDFNHPDGTYMLIESNKIDVGADDASDRRPAQIRIVGKPQPTPAPTPVPSVPQPPPPEARLVTPPRRARGVPERVLFEDKVKSLVDRFRAEMAYSNDFDRMVGALQTTIKYPVARVSFVLNMRTQVEDERGNLSWRDVHPIELRFETDFLKAGYRVCYAAKDVVAYHPNVATLRTDLRGEWPGYICLWDTEGMAIPSVRAPLQFAASLLVEQLNYRRVNLNGEHGRLNPVAKLDRERGGLSVLSGKKLPVVNLPDGRPIGSKVRGSVG